MVVKKVSPITGEVNEMDLPITIQQLKAWAEGEYIQKAFPQLKPEEREFILTGMLPSEWDALFKEQD